MCCVYCGRWTLGKGINLSWIVLQWCSVCSDVTSVVWFAIGGDVAAEYYGFEAHGRRWTLYRHNEHEEGSISSHKRVSVTMYVCVWFITYLTAVHKIFLRYIRSRSTQNFISSLVHSGSCALYIRPPLSLPLTPFQWIYMCHSQPLVLLFHVISTHMCNGCWSTSSIDEIYWK